MGIVRGRKRESAVRIITDITAYLVYLGAR